MNIRQRLTLLIAMTFIALVFIGGFAVMQSRGSTARVRTVTTGVVPSALASVELMSQLKDVQIVTLAMVGAKDADEVARVQTELTARKEALQKALAQQLEQADSDAQRGLIQQAQESLVNYFASIDDTAGFKRAGQTDMAQANMEATVDQYLREQVSIIQTVQVEKRRSKDAAIADLNDRLTSTSTTLTAVTAIATLALTALGIFLYRQITVPLRDMERKMTEIATTQDFSARLDVSRKDEIGHSMLAFNAMIEKIQQSSALVRQKNADIQAMLQNIPQGILTVVADGTVHPEYSQYLTTILQTQDIGGRKVMELLFANSHCGADTLSQVDATIASCLGEDSMNYAFNSHLLVTEIEKRLPDGSTKILDLTWSPITGDNDTVERLMVCVRDVTELRQLEYQAREQKREMAMIGEILAVHQEKFHSFMESAKQFVAENAALLAQTAAHATAASQPETIGLLFRNMHTIKGNARTYGLLYLTNLVHTAEQTYDDMNKAPDTVWDLTLMREQLASVADALFIYEQLNEVKLGRRGPGRRGDAQRYVMVEKTHIDSALSAIAAMDRSDNAAVARALDALHASIRLFGTDRMADVLSGVLESLPSLAEELGKEAPQTVLHDHGIVVQRQATDMLKNVFMHLYRNALDHGIETPQERLAGGKPAQGHIELDLSIDDAQFVLQMRDDGKGLAVRHILNKAIEGGLASANQSLTSEQIAEFIFEPGFSTASRITEVSGRGVGMDAVRSFVVREGGSIHLKFVSDADADADFRQFVMCISLPSKFAVQGPV